MKMKATIAVALSYESNLLILDEPTSGLDPVVRDEILQMIYDYNQENNHAALISSHITTDLEKICDYIVYIHNGRVIFNEEKDELLSKYAVYSVDEQQFKELDKAAIIKVLHREYGTDVLALKEKMPQDFDFKAVTLDDIMLFYSKGESVCYIGPPVEKFGSGLTIGMLYDPKNRAGFRDWDWDEFSFKYKGLYDLDDLYDAKYTRRIMRAKFIKSRCGDSSCCISKQRFIAIRYSHFIKSKPEERQTPEEYIRINYITGEKYDCRPGSLSADGTKKFKIDFSRPLFLFALFGIPFACELEGSEDDPKINIFHAKTEEEYGQFSYWGANTLHFVWEAEDGRDEHLNITGEFTSK